MKRVLFIFSLLIIFSCALFIPGLSDYNSAKKQFRIGQFDVAAYHSYNSLLKNLDNKKAFDLFELSFNTFELMLVFKSLSIINFTGENFSKP